jgi:predicted dehydrogenase
VNFVLRYNRVTDAVSEVLRSGALGAPLAARLNNCASDSKLGPEHWFWRPEVSGGIFIEHGVHFFDLYRHWLACEGHVRCAYAEKRPVGGMEDRVGCLVRHENGAIVSHYHGFDQVGAMDRTDHRIICELGDIRVEGWIPLRMEIDAAVDESALAQLLAISGQNDAHTAPLAAGETRGRGRDWPIDRQARLEYFPLKDKQEVYASSVRDLLADQLAYIVDRGHQRRITELNGLEALKLAGAAREMAARG